MAKIMGDESSVVLKRIYTTSVLVCQLPQVKIITQFYFSAIQGLQVNILTYSGYAGNYSFHYFF